jgi:hypothetical protein
VTSQVEGELQLPEGYVFTEEQLRTMVGRPITGLANGKVVEAEQVDDELVLTMEVDHLPSEDLIRQLVRECRTSGMSFEIKRSD